MTSPREKGQDLERRMADFFASNGYTVARNVILEGRSGGRHEIDILAEKSDGITTFRLLIECKAWGSPIEKDVIAKLDYVLRDLGVNKGIVVALQGWRVGAEQSARQLGIELWGPDEIQKRLGQIALAGLRAGPPQRQAVGFPLTMPRERVASVLRSQSRGLFGLGQEQTIGTWLVWCPFHLFEIACSRSEHQRFRKPTIKTRTVWNLYEALTGSHLTGWGVRPEAVEVSMAISIRPLVKDSAIASEIRKTHNRLLEVVTSSAFDRYRGKLLALGIDPSVTAISIESRWEVYVPFHISLLQARGGERFVAVDGCWGRLWESIGSVLTSTKGYVLDTIGQIPQSPPTRGG